MSLPKVSVVIPVYNGANYISAAICSILAQTYRNIEIVVYDDGSTDRTVKSVGLVKDTRMKVFRGEKNKGVAAARNFLLEHASGEYVMHQDADDLAYPDKIELMLKNLQDKDLVFTCCSNKILASNKVFQFHLDRRTAAKHQYDLEKIFAGNNCMYHRRVIDVGIRYDERLLVGEDTLFEAEIQAKFPGQMEAMEDVLYLYRKHKDGLIVQKKNGLIRIPDEVIEARNKRIKELLEPVVKGTQL